MWYPSFLHGRGSGSQRVHTAHGARRSLRTRRTGGKLNVEALEDRTLLGFLAPLAFDTGRTPSSMAVGDFRHNGILDLAVANSTYPGTVSVLLGNGDGTFQATRNFPAGNRPTSVAVGDFRHNGILDLAVANRNDSSVSVLLGNGDGTFQTALRQNPGCLHGGRSHRWLYFEAR